MKQCIKFLTGKLKVSGRRRFTSYNSFSLFALHTDGCSSLRCNNVSRRFGTSKRFAESDKKEMAELIAIKLQIADDEYHQETAKLTEQLSETRRLAEQHERTERTLDGTLRDFVRRHEKQLVVRPR